MTTIDPHAQLEPDAAAPAGDGPEGARRSTGTKATRVVGIATIVAMGWLVAFGLGFSPADRDQDVSPVGEGIEGREQVKGREHREEDGQQPEIEVLSRPGNADRRA